MTKKYDVITLGRACIDLNAVEYNRPMEDTMTFSKYVGGSPANVAIGAAKLGLNVGFIGKVSDDQHGRFISDYMKDAGVDVSQISLDTEGHKSGLAFTEILSPEECSILMYRDQVADLFLTPDEIDEEYIRSSNSLLISGTSLAQSPSREAALKAVSIANKHNVQVIFELDYRPYTWNNTAETSAYYTIIAEKSDIVVGTRDEFDSMEDFKGYDNETTIKNLFEHRPELIVIKHGVKGSYAYTKDGQEFIGKAYKSNVLKTFGAGDSYCAAFLYALNNGKDIETALKYGSASAAIVVSKHSSSEAMPTVEEIEEIIAKNDTH